MVNIIQSIDTINRLIHVASMVKRARAAAPRTADDRGDRTRQKLLTVAIDVFGRFGFDGASTRMLSDAAGANLQAIPYYFGGKEGLYIAAAEHIGSRITSAIAELRDRVRARLFEPGAKPVSAEEARVLLTQILETMAGLFVSRESEPWARFVIREQMAPTEAFARVYATVMKPTLRVAGKLVGLILEEDDASEHVRMRTLSLLGGVMMFRFAHAAALAHLEWKSIGPRETDAVRALAGELVASLRKAGVKS
jgi:AcrR family transcriptional regulator